MSLLMSSSIFAQPKVTYFRDMISELKLPAKCKSALTKHYQSGKNLSLDVVKKNIRPLKDYAINGVETRDTSSGKIKINGFDFFHYTNNDFSTLASSKNIDSLFKSLKKKMDYGCCGNSFDAGLYVAEDEYTSSDYGKNRLIIELSPETKVFQTSLSGDLLPPLSWDDYGVEFAKKYPAVAKACEFYKINGIVVEDSGASISSYGGGDGAWFVMLNSVSVINVKFEK